MVEATPISHDPSVLATISNNGYMHDGPSGNDPKDVKERKDVKEAKETKDTLPSPSAVDNPTKPPNVSNASNASSSAQRRGSSATPPWRSSSCFLGRQHELHQLHEIKRQVLGTARSASGGTATRTGKTALPPRPASRNGKFGSADAKSDVYPAAIVWGTSGTGKSALVHQFLKTCCTCNASAKHRSSRLQGSAHRSRRSTCSCCYVVCGKYDEYTGSSDPFSAIAQAMRNFVLHLKRGPPEELDRIRECVRAAFPTDGFEPLIKVVPALSILSPNTTMQEDGSRTQQSTIQNSRSKYSAETSSSKGSTSGSQTQAGDAAAALTMTPTQLLGDTSWNQLQYIFLQFIKAVSTKERPMYMFLDDLQWSSGVALRLLASLLEDAELKNFLFVGAIRQETNPHNDEVLELSPEHPLSASFLRRFGPNADGDDEGGAKNNNSNNNSNNNKAGDQKDAPPPAPVSHHSIQPQNDRTLQHITVTDLSLPDMTAWLTALLHCQDIDTLSRKLYAKTSGNIFFTLQALEELERKNILTYDQASSQWRWEIPNQGGDGKGNSRSAGLPISHNVIHAIESKLQELPQLLQRALSVAAYIGSTFHITILRDVLQNEQNRVGGLIESDVDGASIVCSEQALSTMLEQAVLERVIRNPIGGTMYNFAHDHIQKAAYGMVPRGRIRDKLRSRIGHCLLEKYRTTQYEEEQLYQDDGGSSANGSRKTKGSTSKKSRPKTTKPSSPQRHQRQKTKGASLQPTHSASSIGTKTPPSPRSLGIDGLLFVAADHLNAVHSKDQMFTIMMNLEVGEKALEIGALESAAEYLQIAFSALRLVRTQPTWIGAMGNNSSSNSNNNNNNNGASQDSDVSPAWNDEHQYDFCLRLYRARCEVELSLNNFEVGYKLGNELLENARLLEDKLPTYFVMAKALGREDRHEEAQALNTRALRALDEFPKRWHAVRVANSLLKISAFMKKHTNDEIVSMPLMTDPSKTYAMKIGADFGVRAHIISNATLMAFNLCKMLLRTIRYGICEESASAFANYGLIMSSTGDQEMAQRCADIAFAILERTNAKSKRGLVSILMTNYISSFNSPFLEQIKQGRQAHYESMGVGEFEMGILNSQFCLGLSMVVGFELEQLIEALNATVKQHITYEVHAQKEMTGELLRSVETLTGRRRIKWPKLEAQARRGINRERLNLAQGGRDSIHFFARTQLAIYFRRYTAAERFFACYNVFASRDPSYFSLVMVPYLSGLFSAGKYRETGNRRHLVTLRNSIKTMRHVGKTRGRNWMHRALLLEAEELSITVKDKRHTKIKHAYNLAIITASQSMCINDTALAYELAGEHCVLNDAEDLVGDHFTNAVEHYEAWGCKIKVDDIMERRGQYVTARHFDGKINPKMVTWKRRNQTIAELFGIASPTNLAGLEIVSRPSLSDTRSRHSISGAFENLPDLSAFASNSASGAFSNSKTGTGYDGNRDDTGSVSGSGDDDDNVSVLTDNSA